MAAVVCLVGVREPARAAAPARKPWQDLQDGARLVWQHDMLKPILLTSVIWNIAWFVLQAAYVPYAVRTLGLSASGVGFTLAAWGVGMVTGALLAARLIAAMPFGRAIQVGPAASVLASALMAATLLLPASTAHPVLGGVLAALSFFVFGAGPIIWTITSTTLRQTVTPGAVLGSVTAMFLTVNMGARPLGAALGGVIGAHGGESACLWVSLALFALQAVVIVRSPISRLQALPQH
jgi:predicted MFS family arabinose efflux permease